MRRRDALSELPEERIHDLLELGRLDDVEYLLQLVEEHHLLGRVRLRPELEEILDDGLGEGGVLLEELDDAVGELGVIDRQGFGLVQGQQDFEQEGLVLLLERQCEAVYDTAKLNCRYANAVRSWLRRGKKGTLVWRCTSLK